MGAGPWPIARQYGDDRPSPVRGSPRHLRGTVRRGARRRRARSHRDDRRHRHARCAAIGAHGAAEGARCARLRVLHASGRAQGPRAAGQSAGGAAVPLAARAPWACRCGSKARSRSWPMPRPMRISPRGRAAASSVHGRRSSRRHWHRARSSMQRLAAGRAAVRRPRGAAPAALDRLARQARQHRVLVRRRLPPARARSYERDRAGDWSKRMLYP